MRAALLTIALTLCVGAELASAPQRGRQGGATGEKPKVDIVQTVGCAERKAGTPGGRGPGSENDTWWIAHAADPRTAPPALFTTVQVDAAKKVPLGTNTFQLVGVADFLDTEALLKTGQRKEFTTPENANATGELREGRKVLVKGMFVENRINLLAVVALSDTCG